MKPPCHGQGHPERMCIGSEKALLSKCELDNDTDSFLAGVFGGCWRERKMIKFIVMALETQQHVTVASC